jgi:multidrug efflux pump subunit AcrA (membrane-fusion protein)
VSTDRERVPATDGVGGTGVDLDDLPLYSVSLLARPKATRIIVRWLGGLALVGILTLFLPWQQNVQGSGSVTARNPQDRPQSVPTVLAGRLEKWFVQEGDVVKKGQPLLQITEIKEKYLDPNLVLRLGEQVSGKQAAVQQKNAKAASMAVLIEALEQNRAFSLSKAENKVRLYEAALQAAIADSLVAGDQLVRMERLAADGLLSVNSVQNFLLKAQQATAKLVEKRQELANARLEVLGVTAEYGEKIAKARADQEATRAEVGEGMADVAKLRNEYASTEVRNLLYRIDAPQDGRVVRATRAGIGDVLKEGEAVVTLVPVAETTAVELNVNPMDVPLLRAGRKVRLQFEGWPALQFSGWPSTMVGTFGGEIVIIDPVGGKGGKFRILVTPDPDDKPWPTQVRQGTPAYGWALLDTVPLWYEIWRRLNGFTPTVDEADAAGAPSAGDSAKGN